MIGYFEHLSSKCCSRNYINMIVLLFHLVCFFFFFYSPTRYFCHTGCCSTDWTKPIPTSGEVEIHSMIPIYDWQGKVETDYALTSFITIPSILLGPSVTSTKLSSPNLLTGPSFFLKNVYIFSLVKALS